MLQYRPLIVGKFPLHNDFAIAVTIGYHLLRIVKCPAVPNIFSNPVYVPRWLVVR